MTTLTTPPASPLCDVCGLPLPPRRSTQRGPLPQSHPGACARAHAQRQAKARLHERRARGLPDRRRASRGQDRRGRPPKPADLPSALIEQLFTLAKTYIRWESRRASTAK